MANALGLGPSAVRLAGSSPALRTIQKEEATPLLFFLLCTA